MKSSKNENNSDEFEIFENLDAAEKHFQNQGNCLNINNDFKKIIENALEKEEKNIIYKESTDKPFSVTEVKDIINKLKMGKASDPDKILNEILKYSSSATLQSYTKLFNIILKNWLLPKSMESVIHYSHP